MIQILNLLSKLRWAKRGQAVFVLCAATVALPAQTFTTLLGTNLIGATSVEFNGISAYFKVISSSEIVAMIPAGATTGTVQVVTPAGTLLSNVPFRML